MNIFHLANSYATCAALYKIEHRNKIILEITQCAFSAARMLADNHEKYGKIFKLADIKDIVGDMYKPAYINHPCVQYLLNAERGAETHERFMHYTTHVNALSVFNAEHKCVSLINALNDLVNKGVNVPVRCEVPVPLALNNEIRYAYNIIGVKELAAYDAVKLYDTYYFHFKSHLTSTHVWNADLKARLKSNTLQHLVPAYIENGFYSPALKKVFFSKDKMNSAIIEYISKID